jgi:hypothetical protein
MFIMSLLPWISCKSSTHEMDENLNNPSSLLTPISSDMTSDGGAAEVPLMLILNILTPERSR